MDTSVNAMKIVWLGGAGDYNVDCSVVEDVFENLLDSDLTRHQSIVDLMAQVDPKGEIEEHDLLLEAIIDKKISGFVVTLSTPVPHNVVVRPGGDRSWSSNWSHTLNRQVYVESMTEIPALMEEFAQTALDRSIAMEAKEKAA
jgi:hypothetical protein